MLNDDCKRLADTIILSTGRDMLDPEYADTGKRFAGYLRELLCKHTQLEPELRTFETENDELVAVGPIEFYSLCPHHLALVLGKAYVGYIPRKQVLGLSKIPRLVRWLAGDIIKQEDLTVAIATKLEVALFGKDMAHIGNIQPEMRSNGVAVVLQAIHTCMLVRGVKVGGDCVTTTSKMTGCFLDPKKQARAEFLSLVRARG